MSVQNIKINDTIVPAVLAGLVGILSSRKAVFSLICLFVSAFLAFEGKLSIPFATIIGTINTTFLASHTYINSVAIKASSQVQQVINQVKEKIQ